MPVNFLNIYLRSRPLFLSLIRAKEAELYQPYLPLQTPVLDVGCGDGFFAKIALCSKRVNRRVRPWRYSRSDPGQIDVGLDMPNSRIKEAKKAGIYKKLVTYDGQSFPFKDHSFATVVSNSVLEHVPNLEEVVAEIHRVLKPGGIFLTTVMTNKWEEYLFGRKILGSWYVRWMKGKQQHINLLSANDWKKRFEKHHFTISNGHPYLDSRASAFIDFAHYLSLPNLVSYTLFKRWVLLPQFAKFLPIGLLASILDMPVTEDTSAALFFTLEK